MATSAAQAFTLISEAEYARELAAKLPEPREIIKRGIDTTSPLIRLVRPKVSSAVHAPVDVEVKFEARGTASIVPESFRVLYGLFRVDITERLLGHARVTRDGILARGAELPSGNHRLLLEITDSMDRTGELTVKFSVE